MQPPLLDEYVDVEQTTTHQRNIITWKTRTKQQREHSTERVSKSPTTSNTRYDKKLGNDIDNFFLGKKQVGQPLIEEDYVHNIHTSRPRVNPGNIARHGRLLCPDIHAATNYHTTIG